MPECKPWWYTPKQGPKKKKSKRVFPPRTPFRYPITRDEYRELFEMQGGLCAVCGASPQSGLVVDHDHATHKARGLLCIACNTGIGHLKESPKLLMLASDYLVAGGVVTAVLRNVTEDCRNCEEMEVTEHGAKAPEAVTEPRYTPTLSSKQSNALLSNASCGCSRICAHGCHRHD